MIQVQNIFKSYGTLQVLKNVSLEIRQGEVVSIVGASGAGKTTLLQIMGTLDRPDSGTVRIKDTDITRLSERELSRFRNQNIGFVFQFHNLLPEFTALENVCMPALIGGKTMEQAKPEAMSLLEFLNLADRASHKPSELSGGEQQRVAVARALMNNPAVVLADEPSGNLDSVHARELHELFFKLRDHYRQTFVIVTHNRELAEMSDRQITIKDGGVEC
ncbi:MAG: ABC transporter ATP-binding protein [Bacteroidales bacterium]|nr:ABC transporter ATP-binding protein [Bacteroidales bacterium]MBR4715311.1 ABC transporter ATP-binding protein [Bacteroidales bacterium]